MRNYLKYLRASSLPVCVLLVAFLPLFNAGALTMSVPVLAGFYAFGIWLTLTLAWAVLRYKERSR